MNAGPDVERLISDWLIEEAPAHAPDRLLDQAARTIDRTKQRRFGAALREPMILTSSRLLTAAAFVLIAVVGAGVLGRMTAATGVGTLPAGSLVSSPSPSAPTIESYRAARDAICARYSASGAPLKSQLSGIYDARTPSGQRSSKIDALTQFLRLSKSMTAELAKLVAPPEVAADQAADVAHFQDVNLLIAQELPLLGAGQLAQAGAIDQSTDPLSRQIGTFESRYGLAHCP
jgi:hypothetical protein